MKPKRRTKAVIAAEIRFNELISVGLIALGFSRERVGLGFEHEIDTPIGRIRAHGCGTWIHVRFFEPEKARAFVGWPEPNRINGKWNWHPALDEVAGEAGFEYVHQFVTAMRNILERARAL